MYWNGLAKDAKQHCKNCKACQLAKPTKKYGKLPAKVAESLPWQKVSVDLIGPFTVNSPSGTKQLLALTALDPATNWFEICALPDKNPVTVMTAFHNIWLCRYPRPESVTLDNGGEFKRTFKEMLDNYGIAIHVTTAYNPQANSMIKRVHATLEHMLRTFELDNTTFSEEAPWDSYLQSCAWALRSTYHTTLQATPGELVYGRDMLQGIAFQANWDLIRTRKQKLINLNNSKENASRLDHV